MNDYIIGIDGGGTKTLGVLWDSRGKELKRVIKGFSNFNVDLEIAKSNLEETISSLLDDSYKVSNIIIGVSGYSGLKLPLEYEDKLKKQFKTNIILKDDGFLALNSVNNENKLPVVLVISGTGSIVYGLKEHNYYRFGGHGQLLGDEGSGYHLVIDSLKSIIEEFDKDLNLSVFSKHFLKEANFRDVNEIKQFVYHTDKSKIASLARHTYNFANENELAKKLVVKTANDLVEQTLNIIKKMNIKDKFILALRGGLFENSLILKNEFISKLENNKLMFEIDNNIYEPVMGALNIAKEIYNE